MKQYSIIKNYDISIMIEIEAHSLEEALKKAREYPINAQELYEAYLDNGSANYFDSETGWEG